MEPIEINRALSRIKMLNEVFTEVYKRAETVGGKKRHLLFFLEQIEIDEDCLHLAVDIISVQKTTLSPWQITFIYMYLEERPATAVISTNCINIYL